MKSKYTHNCATLPYLCFCCSSMSAELTDPSIPSTTHPGTGGFISHFSLSNFQRLQQQEQFSNIYKYKSRSAVLKSHYLVSVWQSNSQNLINFICYVLLCRKHEHRHTLYQMLTGNITVISCTVILYTMSIISLQHLRDNGGYRIYC